MTTSTRAHYAGYRFPAEIIGHAVWVYFRFPLGLRMVKELLAARGIIVSHETVRQWALKFGQQFANEIRRCLRGLAIDGIWMRSRLRLLACSTGCGGRSTRTASYSIFSFKADAISGLLSGCFGN